MVSKWPTRARHSEFFFFFFPRHLRWLQKHWLPESHCSSQHPHSVKHPRSVCITAHNHQLSLEDMTGTHPYSGAASHRWSSVMTFEDTTISHSGHSVSHWTKLTEVSAIPPTPISPRQETTATSIHYFPSNPPPSPRPPCGSSGVKALNRTVQGKDGQFTWYWTPRPPHRWYQAEGSGTRSWSVCGFQCPVFCV